jgi:hypothetical protein
MRLRPEKHGSKDPSSEHLQSRFSIQQRELMMLQASTCQLLQSYHFDKQSLGEAAILFPLRKYDYSGSE